MNSEFSEQQMNLSVLQQKDPFIVAILDCASQVAAYSFNASNSSWEKTNVEGTLFVYTRSAYPKNGFMIINRLRLNDLFEPIVRDLEFQLQDPFLLYKNSNSSIYGIWFYDKNECLRVGHLMDQLVKSAEINISQMATKSEIIQNVNKDKISKNPLNIINSNQISTTTKKNNNVNIMDMLLKAKDVYDKQKTHESQNSINKKNLFPSSPIRPTVAKQQVNNFHDFNSIKINKSSVSENPGQPTPTPIILESLFKKASQHQQQQQQQIINSRLPQNNEQKFKHAGIESAFHHPPPIHASATVEEIEKQQREDEEKIKNYDVTFSSINPNNSTSSSTSLLSSLGKHITNTPIKSPESPNTTLKRTLKISTQPVSISLVSSFSSVTTISNFMTNSSLSSSVDASKPYTPSSSSETKQIDTFSTVNQSLNSQKSESPYSTNKILFTSSILGNKSFSRVSATFVTTTTHSTATPTEDHLKFITPIHTEYSSQTKSSPISIVSDHSEFILTSHQNQCQEPLNQIETPKQENLQQIKNNFSLNSKSGLPLLSPLDFQVICSGSKNKKSVFKNISSSKHTPPKLERNFCKSGSDNGELIEEEENHVTPLNKEQLKQALISLLKSDSSFLEAIHGAYVESLNTKFRLRHKS